MRITSVTTRWCVAALLAFAASGAVVRAEAPRDEPDPERVTEWNAPPYWVPRPAAAAVPEAGTTTSQPIPFHALAPCRLADTRDGNLPSGYGPPSMNASVARSFVAWGRCGVPATAAAVSVNITVTSTLGPGYVSAWPTGSAQPVVSTLNYVANQTIANGAVVPLGASGDLSIACMNAGCQLIVDTNGYYAATGVVTGVNGIAGDLSVAAGNGISVDTNAGSQSITLSATLTLAGSGTASTAAHSDHKHDGSDLISGSIPDARLSGTYTGPLALTNSGNFLAAGIVDLGTGGALKRGTALLLHSTGANNSVFLGYGAGNASITGAYNTAVGGNALLACTTCGNSVAVGTDALKSVTTGYENTAVGVGAGSSLTVGIRNSFFGYGAGTLNTVSGNSAFGDNALAFNATGPENSAFGVYALFKNTAAGNSAFGSNALYANTSGANNAAFGFHSLIANTTGGDNAAFGYNTLATQATGLRNSAFGSFALANAGEVSDNAAFGYQALKSTTKGGLAAFGSSALRANTTGTGNSAFGWNALSSVTIGSGNTAVGQTALNTLVAGDNNTAVGQGSLANALESENTAVGRAALGVLQSGSGNVAVGYQAGGLLTSGVGNVYVGANAGGGASESNTIRIGTSQTSAYLAGVYGVTASNGAAVYVNASGQLGTVVSSRRFKEDVSDVGDASDVLLRLRPVSFRYLPSIDPARERQYGLIAEEVEAVAPELVVHGPDGTPDTVKYQLVNALLLDAVQKLARRADAQEREIEALRAALARAR